MDTAALASFGGTFHGEIVPAGSASYETAGLVWNGMIDRRPADAGEALRPLRDLRPLVDTSAS
jgi:hypothetical protein